MGYGPTWVTSVSPARLSHTTLWLRSSLHRGMWPEREPKAFPGVCLPAPTETGGDKGGAGGATSSSSAAAVSGWQQEVAHPAASPCTHALRHCTQGSPAPPVYPEPVCWGGFTALPSVLRPLLSPTQGAPTGLASPGAPGVVPCGCTLRLSPAGAKRVPTHGGRGGVRGLRREQPGTGGGRRPSGGRGSAALCQDPGGGWAKGLGALRGSLALAP